MRSTDTFSPTATVGIWHSISRLIWDSDLVMGRFMLFVAELIWGVTLFLPGDTFSSEKLPHLAFLSEYVWGFIFLSFGIIQISIIIYEHIGSSFSKVFNAFNAFLWIYLVFSIIIDSYPPVVGIAGEITLMITAVWIWIRPYILAEGLYRAGFR